MGWFVPATKDRLKERGLPLRGLLDIQKALCDNHLPILAHVGLTPSTITWTGFRAEHARLRAERVAAFGEFKADVATGAYPGAKHVLPLQEAAFETFLAALHEPAPQALAAE